jgi:C4-dicarboxylate-binding protein DctP
MTSVRNRLALLAFATISFFIASTVHAADAQFVIKFSHVVAQDTPKGKAADMFKRLVEEKTQGRVKVEVYPNSILYKDKEELEALQLGAVQMLAPSTAKFGPLGVKEFDALALPYLFNGYDQVHHVLQGPIGEGLLKKLEPHGMTGLAFWDSGFKQFFGNRVMRSPADLKGMKIRIQSSKVLEAQMRSLNVIPQVMAFSELYPALQTGVIDGDEQSTPNVWTQKLYEVEKNMTYTNHGYTGYAVVVNKKFWDGLPADIRAQLTSAMAETTKYANDIAQKDNETAFAEIRRSGRVAVISPTAAELTAWKHAMVPMHREVEARVGKDIVEAIYKDTGFNASAY